MKFSSITLATRRQISMMIIYNDSVKEKLKKKDIPKKSSKMVITNVCGWLNTCFIYSYKHFISLFI